MAPGGRNFLLRMGDADWWIIRGGGGGISIISASLWVSGMPETELAPPPEDEAPLTDWRSR